MRASTVDILPLVGVLIVRGVGRLGAVVIYGGQCGVSLGEGLGSLSKEVLRCHLGSLIMLRIRY